MSNAKQVAAYLLKKANSLGNEDKSLSGNNDVTNLKLQKLLYFAQVEYIKQTGKKLFDDSIQAWQYGPVVPKIYEWLKGCGGYVITEFDISLEAADGLNEDIKKFLDWFWDKYSNYSAWGLVQKTHEPSSPWSKVYKDGSGDKQEIPFELLKQAN